ncbi:hypothetical protein NMY22_g19479 [Coprinellus aureogranulatus]|nr:hypothetical protein NMY22_g19479 [Coprinellus aureogranulatus]
MIPFPPANPTIYSLNPSIPFPSPLLLASSSPVKIMPLTRPGFTIIQSLDLRMGAIEWLRCLERRSCQQLFFSEWWAFWLDEHGIPDPDNWNDVHNYENYVAEYRRRVLRTVRWHAGRGHNPPSSSAARMRRIRTLMAEVVRDFNMYRQAGIDLNERRSSLFGHLFEDTIHIPQRVVRSNTGMITRILDALFSPFNATKSSSRRRTPRNLPLVKGLPHPVTHAHAETAAAAPAPPRNTTSPRIRRRIDESISSNARVH